jgi:hypothetical protein
MFNLLKLGYIKLGVLNQHMYFIEIFISFKRFDLL